MVRLGNNNMYRVFSFIALYSNVGGGTGVKAVLNGKEEMLRNYYFSRAREGKNILHITLKQRSHNFWFLPLYHNRDVARV